MIKCPYCSSADIETLLEIPNLPNFLSAVDKDKLIYLKTFKYSLSYCKNCELGFNSSPLSDEDLSFIYENYEYILPSMGIGQAKYARFIELVKKSCAPADKIVEIGSNDCFVLKNLKDSGFNNLLGIEPSPNSNHCKGIEVIKAFYEDNLFEDHSVDAFLMMHVFEHFRNPFEVLKSLKKKLTSNGKLIIEVPNFSGFHHQHLFYYNVNFLRRLADDVGLYISFMEIDKEPEDVIRVIFSANKPTISVDIPKDEKRSYLTSTHSFNAFKKKLRDLFLEMDNIVIWGAGSSSVVCLSLIENEILKGKVIAVVDGDYNKAGKVLPIINKVVQPVETLKGREIENLLIMSSFYQEILERMKKEGINAKRVDILY